MAEKERREKTESRFGFSALAGALQIPEDFAKGNVLVSMQGQERIIIENFKGISSYTTEEIRLLTRKKKICVTGRRLTIKNYSREEIEIAGFIEKVEYL